MSRAAKSHDGMQEQSHLDEMRAAIRGERERAEERRKSSENVLAGLPQPERPPEPDPEPPPAAARPGRFRRLFGR